MNYSGGDCWLGVTVGPGNVLDQQSLPCSSCEVVEADLVLLDLEALIALHRLGEDKWAILVFQKVGMKHFVRCKLS